MFHHSIGTMRRHIGFGIARVSDVTKCVSGEDVLVKDVGIQVDPGLRESFVMLFYDFLSLFLTEGGQQ